MATYRKAIAKAVRASTPKDSNLDTKAVNQIISRKLQPQMAKPQRPKTKSARRRFAGS